MWGNRCSWVRVHLPLLAGGELVGLDRRWVERHLIVCPDCRSELTALQNALVALQAAAASSSLEPGGASLWPALARQIQESRHLVRYRPVARPRAAVWACAALFFAVLLTAWLLRPPAKPAAKPLASARPAVIRPVPPPAPRALTVPVPVASQRESPKEITPPSEPSSSVRVGFDTDRSSQDSHETQPSN
jgi:putative zinc finger protein